MEKQGLGWDVSIAAAAGGSNVSNVTFSVLNNDGLAVKEPVMLDIWLSDSSTGIGLTGTVASGGIAAASGAGTVLGALTTAKAVRGITNASGVFTLAITDSAKTAFYPCCSVPNQGGRITVGSPLTTANFG